MRLYEFITEARRPTVSVEQIDQIAKEYAAGMSVEAVTRNHGIAQHVAFYHLRKRPDWEEIKAKHRENSNFPDFGNKKITPEQIDQMAKEYASGMSLDDVATNYRISNGVKFYHLRKRPDWEEIKAKHRENSNFITLSKGITPEQIDQMAKEYATGMILPDIAKNFGITQPVAFYHLSKRPDWEEIKVKNRENSNLTRFKKGITPEQIDQMAKEYTTGLSFLDVGKNAGIDATTVHYHLRKRPDWAEIKSKHDIEYRSILAQRKEQAANSQSQTKIYRAGEIGNDRLVGPGRKNYTASRGPKKYPTW